MSTHVKPAPRHEFLLGAWHAQVAATAKHSPWLVREMLRRKQELLPKFATYYQQLRTLPRRTRRLLQRKWACSLAGVALLLAVGGAEAHAGTTINVSAGNVTALVQAINDANSEVAPFDGADTIVLDGSTFTLNNFDNYSFDYNGLPVITTEITIQGNGSTIQRAAAAPNFRLFFVESSGNLTLQDTTVSGGSVSTSGGGAYNRGALTLNNSTITGNTVTYFGGGIFNKGTLNITNNSVISDNVITTFNSGGGIYNTGGTVSITNSTITGNSASAFGGGIHTSDFGGPATLSITNSMIVNNTAYNGGGVYTYHTTSSITDSTISGNTASFNGGGVANFDGTLSLTNSTVKDNTITSRAGGGISNVLGSLTVTNSTVSGNTAASLGGGVYNYNGSAALTNSTISGNLASDEGGGVFNYLGVISLSNSTIAGNMAANSGGGVSNHDILLLSRTLLSGNIAPTGPEVVNAGAVTADNFNLFGVNGNAGVVGFTPGATDVAPGTGTVLTDILDPILSNNGGPTETHALVPGSPAIDASPADADCEPTDQRGVARPQGAACDIGAFEFDSGSPGPMHDLAVLKVTPPKTVTLTSKKPVQSKTVKVQLQNQGEVDETIPNAGALTSLVQLDLESLDTVNDCPDLAATLDASKLKFPLTLKAGKTPLKGKKLTVSFTVTFDRNECIPDPGKSSKKDPGHEDYRPTATVDLSALGETDVDPTDDTLEGALIDVVKKP